MKPKQTPRLKAIVRAFDIILSFESDKSDNELEAQANDLIKKINALLQAHMIGELPQLEFDNQNGKKKMKIGVRPIHANDLLEDE